MTPMLACVDRAARATLSVMDNRHQRQIGQRKGEVSWVGPPEGCGFFPLVVFHVAIVLHF